MTLTNPTDADLNAAFAEYVAGWTHLYYEEGEDVDIDARELYPWAGMRGLVNGERRIVPPFCESMDTVLPWLEKAGRWNVFRDMSGIYEIELEDKPMPDEGNWFAFGTSLPRAVVIALLRANGVTVTIDT